MEECPSRSWMAFGGDNADDAPRGEGPANRGRRRRMAPRESESRTQFEWAIGLLIVLAMITVVRAVLDGGWITAALCGAGAIGLAVILVVNRRRAGAG